MMKISIMLLALIMIPMIGFATPAESQSSTIEVGTHRVEHLKVLEVFSASDGAGIFRSYSVEWNGQKVIAEDALVSTDYEIGEVIPVLVSKHEYPRNKKPFELMKFTAMPREMQMKEPNKPVEGTR